MPQEQQDRNQQQPGLNFNFWPQAQQPATPAQPKSQGGLNFNFWNQRQQAQKPLTQTAEPQDTGRFRPGEGLGEKALDVVTQSAFRTAFGWDAQRVYNKLIDHLPKSWTSTETGRFFGELAKGGPEVMDALTSPLGVGIAVLHIAPKTRPIAVGIDTLLSLYQAGRTGLSWEQEAQQPTPEHLAAAIKDTLYTYGIVKGKRAALKAGLGYVSSERAAQAESNLAKLKELAPVKGDTKKVTKAKLNAQRAELSRIATPANKLDQALHTIYSTPGVRAMAAFLDLPKPAGMDMGQLMIRERNSMVRSEEWRLRRLMWQLRRNVPAEDRDVQKLGYVIQGDATPDEVGLSQAARDMLPTLRQFSQDASDVYKKVYGPDLMLQDPSTYLAQIWTPESIGKVTAGVTRKYAGRLTLKDRFLKQRSIESYKEGIEEWGAEPQFRDVADIIEARHRLGYTAASNFRMARGGFDIGAFVSEAQARRNPYYANWPKLDSDVLKRASYAGKSKGKKPATLLRIEPIRVHPDLWMPTRAIFGKGEESFEGTGKLTPFGMLEKAGSLTKSGVLMASFFHAWNLSWQQQAVQLGTAVDLARQGRIGESLADLGRAATSWFFFDRNFHKGLRTGIWEAFGGRAGDRNAPTMLRVDPEIAYPWLMAHANMAGTTDRQTALINWLKGLDVKKGNPMLRGVKYIGKFYGNLAQVYDKAIFDYYMPASQLAGMESIYADEIGKIPNATPEQAHFLRTQIAAHANRVYGTESLEEMLASPRTRQWMNRLLLAPQWTLSNIRVFSSGYESEIQRRLKDQYVVGAALAFFIGTNLMNRLTTSWYDKDDKGNHTWKGRWTWENPGLPMQVMTPFGQRENETLSEHAVDVFVGKNEDGSDRYFRPFGAFRDVFKWLYDPRQTLQNKAAPVPKIALGLGGAGIGYVAGERGATAGEKTVDALFSALQEVTPISIEAQVRTIEHWMIPEAVPESYTGQFLNLPTVKGVTLTRAVEAYTEAMRRGKPHLAELILKVATRNGLKPSSIVSSYRNTERVRRRRAQGPAQRYDVFGTPTPPPPR